MITKNLIREISKELNKINEEPQIYSEGRIINIGDGIATISGLPEIKYNELVEFPYNIKGIAFNLEEEQVGIIILGDYIKLKSNDQVKRTNRILNIPASEDFLGRVIDPLGEPLDGQKEVKAKQMMPLEKLAPTVIVRQPVHTPLQTGIKAIDSMTPIGRGQRELIIGDRGTGKTAIAVDTIINQKGQNTICIYVAIGQKSVRVARIYEKLKALGAMDYTIIISAGASDSASMQYIAPYSGCAMAEYFMGLGKDVLIIYDDLSKHAWAYRQISLLLKRPTGREAYPGDIFYLHSRLLERSACMDKKYGGGSITALPIIETQAGDMSAYIPTNVISITDGQIYLEQDLFFAGVKPAINVGLSVSRVGGAAQIKAMKKIAGQLRLDLAQFRELAAFTQFSTDLDSETKKKIDRGSRITEIFKQPQYIPYPVEQQVCIIWAVTKGYLDDLPVDYISSFEAEFLNYLKNKKPDILKEIIKLNDLNEITEKELVKVLNIVKTNFKNKYKLNKEEIDNGRQS